MLDLTKINETYAIKWFDGTIYHLRKPTQSLLTRILQVDNITDTNEQLIAIGDIMSAILNNNIEKKEFTKEDLEVLDIETTQLILEDYINTTMDKLGE